jgi:Fe-S-cluster-containing dehydrogenase component
MKPYELIIDEKACWGCRTCEVACMQEFDLKGSLTFITVTEETAERGADQVQFSYGVNLCRHCDPAPCLEACPEAAISQRDDGIVVLSSELCTGCQACMSSCPYDALVFDDADAVARKCNLCHHRVDHGLLPACADNVCLAHCIYFGSPEDIAAQRSKQ